MPKERIGRKGKFEYWMTWQEPTPAYAVTPKDSPEPTTWQLEEPTGSEGMWPPNIPVSMSPLLSIIAHGHRRMKLMMKRNQYRDDMWVVVKLEHGYVTATTEMLSDKSQRLLKQASHETLMAGSPEACTLVVRVLNDLEALSVLLEKQRG